MTARQKSRLDTRKGKGQIAPIATPRLSVILCTYNRCNLVLSTLASLRRQTLPYNQFEILVVDNGSSDGTLNAVRAYVNAGRQEDKPPEHIWRVRCLYEPRRGVAYARNTGLLTATGEVAVFLDDDAVADPYWLERLLAAYDETQADAIGGRVELRWEATRPHWLSDDLLELLGYYAPAMTRILLQPSVSFSSCNFSVKIKALRAIGYFSPFLSKRLHVPASVEVADLCCRLHVAGYTLWYEPEAIVMQRTPAARLTLPFFIGQAYWQGRSEVLAHYVGAKHNGDTQARNTIAMFKAVLHDTRDIASLALVQLPLLWLARRSTNEHLLADMGQARSWGRLQQHLQLLAHAPAELATIPVLLVRTTEPDPTAELLAQALNTQDIYCIVAKTDIPLSWLWQHRASQRQPMGILHVYRSGAWQLTPWQRQHLGFRLWLAQQWGICIVATDAGGWWQSNRSLRFLSRRALERSLLRRSRLIFGYTRQPEQLYPDKRLRRRVRCLPHPGFRGYYPAPLARNQARTLLGLPTTHSFVYLCFASQHTEQELLLLIEAFGEMLKDESSGKRAPQNMPQLLLLGPPVDGQSRILLQATRNPALHLSLAIPKAEDMPLYLGASNAIVLPHFALHTAGVLETALLALSYELVVVAPNLPRFRGMLPPRASLLYEAGSRTSLKKALVKAQTLTYTLTEKEATALDAESGWEQYTQRLAQMYRELLEERA